MATNPSWTRGRFLGRGSTATVYLASGHPSGELFAVKSTDLSDAQLLRREQRIHSSLASSPYVVSYLGCDVTSESSGEFYNLLLEYAPNGSLSEKIKESGLEEAGIRSYTRDILMGLSHLHSMKIAHCDVKPHNVLVGCDGRAKISDLGCAVFADGCGDGTWRFMGTPMYMAPEVARGEKQGLEADIWALGCTVIEMATGRAPWKDVADAGAVLYQVGFGNETPELPHWISEEGKDFLGKCLRRKIEERWSVDELLMHPFLSNLSSPKSTLDRGYWDLTSEEDDEEEENEEENVNFAPKRSNSIDELLACSDRPSWIWDEDWITVRVIGDESSTSETNGVGDGTISTGIDEDFRLSANQHDLGDLRHDLHNIIGGNYGSDGMISRVDWDYVQTDSDESMARVGSTTEIIAVGNATASASSSEESVLSILGQDDDSGDLRPDSDNDSVVISDDCERDDGIRSHNCSSLTVIWNSNWNFVSVPVISMLLLITFLISCKFYNIGVR